MLNEAEKFLKALSSTLDWKEDDWLSDFANLGEVQYNLQEL